MKLKNILTTGVLAFVAMSSSQSAFAAKKEKNTWIGVGLGALAGSLLSNGDPVAILGGAAAGGVVGNITTDDDRRRDRSHGRDGRHEPRAQDRRGQRDNRFQDGQRGRGR